MSMFSVCANCLHTNGHNGGEEKDEGLCTRQGCACDNLVSLTPGDLVIKFEGHITIKMADIPDEIEGVEEQLYNELHEAVNTLPNIEEVFDKLHLDYSIGKIAEPKSHIIKWGKFDGN